MSWAAAVVAALSAWGWSGLDVTIRETDNMHLEGSVAQAWPRGLGGCTIDVRPGVDPWARQAIVMHEMGHCVGVYEHSEEPGSVMRSWINPSDPGAITEADRLASRSEWLRWLGSDVTRVVVPGVAR